MTVLIDSSTVASPSDTNCDSSQLMGQSFQVQNDATLDSLIIDIKKVGTISGSFQFEIYAISGTYGSTSIPTGSVLATSDSVSTAGITTSYVTTTINFSGANRIAMTAGQQYALVCNYSATAYPNSLLFKNKTPSFHGGNQSYKAAGVWYSLAAYDVVFDLEGVASVVNVTVTPSVIAGTLATVAPTVILGATVLPSTQITTVTTISPNVTLGVIITPAVQQVTVTEEIPTVVVADTTAFASVIAGTIALVSPTIVADTVVAVTTQNTTLGILSPSILYDIVVPVSVQELVFSQHAPSIYAAGYTTKYTTQNDTYVEKFTHQP